MCRANEKLTRLKLFFLKKKIDLLVDTLDQALYTVLY